MAGTITGAINRIPTQQGRPQMAEVILTCIGDSSDGGFPVTVINTLAGISDYTLWGLKLYSVKVVIGATGPTAASDLTITDKFGLDLLGGKGTNLIPNSGMAWSLVGPASLYSAALITGNISVTITGNSVNSAVVYLILELVGD